MNWRGVHMFRIIAKNKGPGYERWAKLHNIKAISKTLIFLSEKGLGDYEKLSEAAKEARVTAPFIQFVECFDLHFS